MIIGNSSSGSYPDDMIMSDTHTDEGFTLDIYADENSSVRLAEPII